VLSGDTHHYSRYVEGDLNYITAGGGGAFLHPTHDLTNKKFEWPYPPPGIPFRRGKTYTREFKLAPRLFPTRTRSWILSLRCFAFAILNWSYALTLGGACAFFAWMLDANARALQHPSLADVLKNQSFNDAAWAYFNLVLASPWPLTLVGLAAGGYYYLADFERWRRLLAGFLHTLVQTLPVAVATIWLGMHMPKQDALPPWLSDRWLLILCVGIAGGFLCATMLGTYFFLCLTLFRKHWNEAFSALRVQNYKNFLRMCIDRNGQLNVYPIGLKRVPRDNGKRLRNPPLVPHLIERLTPIS